MKNKTVLMFVLMSVLSLTSFALAYDASTPYTVTMNFIVGEDTTFTVALAGAETTIDFNPADQNSKNVEPDSQVRATGTPIATITNAGNTNLDFSNNVTTAMPSFAAVSHESTNTSITWANTLSTTASSLATSVAPAGTAEVYMYANFTSATAGTTPRTYQINSVAS